MRDLEEFGGTSGAPTALPTRAEIDTLRSRLGGSSDGLDDAERIDLIRALEELKCAAEGAQAALTADFDASQRAAAASAGQPAERQGRGIALQIALARRESHRRGQSHVGLAKTLTAELPCAYDAFRAGRVSEWKVVLLARETACLSREHRMLVDEAVAGDAERFEAMGDRQLVGEVVDLASRLDAGAVAERRRRAEADRHTTLRPAPDTMTWFGALLPVKDGVAVHKALLDEADRLKAGPAELPLLIHVVVPDTVLLGDRDGGGHVDGYGPVPGDLLRAWIADHADRGVKDCVRRLYQRPATRELVAMDQKGRRFEGGLAEFLRLRDQRCRNPWCNAPIRHHDHARDHAKGGRTGAKNGQGLCEACNHAKQADGWSARPVDGPVHTIEIITPTGHRYLSTVPTTGPPLWMQLYPDARRVA